MEFIAFSDLHGDKNHNKSYVMENGMTSWPMHQMNVLDQIIRYGKDNNIHNIFFGADLFTKKNYIPQDLYNLVWNKFYEMSKDFKIYMNTGNHDFHSKISSSLRPFSTICDVISTPKDIEFGGDLIRILPHGMVDKNLGIPIKNKYKNYILFTHEDIEGLKYTGSDHPFRSKYKKQIFGDWNYIFNGHIHTPQKIGNIINMGSVMRIDFGETEDKFFYHYKGREINQIEVDCPKFIKVSGFSEKVRKKISVDDYNFYRIDISPEELADPIFNQYNVFPNIIKVKERKKRMETNITEEEELLKYMEIEETELDKDKLLEFAEELK